MQAQLAPSCASSIGSMSHHFIRAWHSELTSHIGPQRPQPQLPSVQDPWRLSGVLPSADCLCFHSVCHQI